MRIISQEIAMEAPHINGELSLKEIQLAALEILKNIDAICHEEDIRYWAMYGTLIGAVRHHGFIPWDDDLDIAMPRPDYERFLEWFRTHSQEVRPLVALDGYRQGLPFLITRVSDTSYKMIGEYGEEAPELGAFVDVYPLDGCGTTLEDAQEHKKHCMTQCTRYLQAGNFIYNNRNTGPIKRALKRVHSAMLGDARKQAEKLHAMSTQVPFENAELVSCLEWDWALSKIYPRTAFEESKRVPFENYEIQIPAGYDSILTAGYGDYMQLPPENERIGHHFYSIIKR